VSALSSRFPWTCPAIVCVPAAHAQYGGCAAGMLLFGFLFANAVPFFGDMLGYVLYPLMSWFSRHSSYARGSLCLSVIVIGRLR
jgi:hypothetical protein